MKKLFIVLFSVMSLTACDLLESSSKPSPEAYAIETLDASNVSKVSASLTCKVSTPDSTVLNRDCYPYIMLSNTDMETLWTEGRIDPTIFGRATGNFPTSILDIRPGESFIYEDKIQIISVRRTSGDNMFALVSNLTPDTEYYYSTALLVAGEPVSAGRSVSPTRLTSTRMAVWS